MAQAQGDVIQSRSRYVNPAYDPSYVIQGMRQASGVGVDMKALQDAQRRALMAVGNMQARGRQAAAAPLAGTRLLQAPAFNPAGGTVASKLLLGQ